MRFTTQRYKIISIKKKSSADGWKLAKPGDELISYVDMSGSRGSNGLYSLNIATEIYRGKELLATCSNSQGRYGSIVDCFELEEVNPTLKFIDFIL